MKKIVLSGLFLLTCVICFSQTSPDDILGKWYTEGNESIVEIYKQSNKYFGKLIWLEEPLNDSGQPKRDINNPDETKRNQTIKGLIFMFNFIFDDDEWTDGTVYDPQSGNTYDAEIEMDDQNTLDLRGFIGISLLGRTTTWKRVAN